MPVYPYKCPHCEATKEVNAKITEEHEPPKCDHCNVTMVRDWSQNTTTFTFGSAKTNGTSVSQIKAEQTAEHNRRAADAEKKKYKSRYV